MTIRSSLAAGLVGLCAIPIGAWKPASSEVFDVRSRVAEARATLAQDLAAWARHAFQRRVSRERLNRGGVVVWRETYVFEVRPNADGFEEVLLSINGRAPKEREVADHRRAGRFAKHYDAAVEARLRNPFGEDLPLQPLLFDQEHQWVGRETVDGLECDRIAFDARPRLENSSLPERLERAARGTLCVSVAGAHIVEAEVESVRPVGQAPLRLDRLTLRFESRPIGETWLPRLFETTSDFRLLLRSRRTRNRYEYSEYRRP